jgi:hypothetical protein
MISGSLNKLREEIKKFLEFNENESTTSQNLWDIAKTVLRGKFKTMNAYIKSTEGSQANDLMLHLKLLVKQEQGNPQIGKRTEIKIRPQVSKIETKKTIQRINVTKS